MNWTSTSKRASLGAALVVSLGILVNTGAMEASYNHDCYCSASAHVNLSHAVNFDEMHVSHCAKIGQDKINWFDWIGGKSPSYQFHFLDLLELLYGEESTQHKFSKRPGGSL